MIEGKNINLIEAEDVNAEALLEYRIRNRSFLAPYEIVHSEEYYTLESQKNEIMKAKDEKKAGRGVRFYIESRGRAGYIIGTIALSNIVRGAFQSCFLGYSLDYDYLCRGYMSEAVSLVTEYAFKTLNLHRVEANVMPRNKASLRVLEKNGYSSEGISPSYLYINGVWEDHIHMVILNN